MVETLLKSFENLPDTAKREAAAEILKRAIQFKLSPLNEDALLETADSVFIELDQEESRHS